MTFKSESYSEDQQQMMNALARCPEFDVFDETEKLMLLKLAETEEFAEGNQVFSMDHGGEQFYIVIYGKFSLRLKSNDYKQCKVGDIFGEIAVFSKRHRLGTVLALEPSKLIVFNSEKFFNPEFLPPAFILKLIKALTNKMISYFYQEELLSSAEMITRGENECREFKESTSKVLKESIVRTLSAFMNLNGGTIFVGVKNDGTIKGVRGDLADFDKYQLDIRSLIRLRLGTYFNEIVYFATENINGKKIIRIDCDASKSPVFFKKSNNKEELEEFVVRTGAANTHLKKGSEIIKYYQRRYKN